MAIPGRLRLRSQIIPGFEKSATHKPFVRVWVDTGVFHLDKSYDYRVPEVLSDGVQIGVRVQVPFNSREVEAIVLERIDRSEITGAIAWVSKIISPHPVATKQSLQLIDQVAKSWATHPFDIVRSAIPPRIASVDKKFSDIEKTSSVEKKSKGIYSFVAFEPYISPSAQLISLVQHGLKDGCVLVIAPNERDIDAIVETAKLHNLAYIRLDSSITRAQRYENFLLAMNTKRILIIGARSAIFAPIKHLSTVIVYKESSHEHYEIRNPAWNVRDVLNLRRGIENLDVVFSGYVPSLEISALIDSKRMTYLTHSHMMPVKSFSSDDGALLPGRIFSHIRAALAQGPVLFLIARKGYGNALLCAHCRNIALCNCGARLVVGSKGAAPSCTLCQRQYPQWSCQWCAGTKQYLAGRGIERAAQEISRAFTGYPIILSFGDVIKSQIENRPAIVLATPGSAPSVIGGYSAVVILDGLRFFSHADQRAQERARELFFESASMINSKGVALICIEQSHPVVAALTKWSPGVMIRRELAERLEIGLPPFVRSFVITGSSTDFTSIAAGLRKAVADRRIAASVKILGPSQTDKNQAKIVLYCPRQEATALTNFLHELSRRRSIAKKEYLTIRIDPYSL
ncbi:MAG: hypothetical protein O3A27_03445 [Actinomycetota bacterium]|nr:hypothetical protein [Actinomycetota bacterium]